MAWRPSVALRSASDKCSSATLRNGMKWSRSQISSREEVRGGRERDPHAPRRGVAGGAHQRRGPAVRSARERRSLVIADERAAVGRIGDAQTDPQRAVGEQALADHPGGALGSEQRCMPNARPRAATSVNTACSSGCSPRRAANSSTTMTSRGRSTRGSRMSRAPARASSASLQRTSARRLSMARLAPAPSRSVMTPVTWGTSARTSNAVPPLKSARRKLTSRVECVGAQRHDPGHEQLATCPTR